MNFDLADVARQEALPRPATAEDLGSLLALKRAAVDRAYGGQFPEQALDSWKARFVSREYFQRRLVEESSLNHFFYTGSEDSPTGMVCLKERDGIAYIGDLYLRDTGGGVGRRLLRHALEHARMRGFELAIADAFDGNHAVQALLASEGFEPVDAYDEPSLHTSVSRYRRSLANSKAA
jgi:GNAT superfamily N-acetyltransferase